MPTYAYHCDTCKAATEEFHNVADRHSPSKCPECGHPLVLDAFTRSGAVRGNYAKAVELLSMGFLADPEDVAEHRSRFPNTELVMREGSAIPVVRSLGEKRAYMKAAGWADTKDYR